jgi:hypothetical protein
MASESLVSSASIIKKASENGAGFIGPNSAKLLDSGGQFLNENTRDVFNNAGSEKNLFNSDVSESTKEYLMPEAKDSKKSEVQDKKKEPSDDFNFSDKKHTELVEGNNFNAINEPIVFLDMICQTNVDEYKSNNNISAPWISSGEPKSANSNHDINVDRINIAVYKIFIFLLLTIATLIVLGKI